MRGVSAAYERPRRTIEPIPTSNVPTSIIDAACPRSPVLSAVWPGRRVTPEVMTCVVVAARCVRDSAADPSLTQATVNGSEKAQRQAAPATQRCMCPLREI